MLAPLPKTQERLKAISAYHAEGYLTITNAAQTPDGEDKEVRLGSVCITSLHNLPSVCLSVSLSVCLFICPHHGSKHHASITTDPSLSVLSLCPQSICEPLSKHDSKRFFLLRCCPHRRKRTLTKKRRKLSSHRCWTVTPQTLWCIAQHSCTSHASHACCPWSRCVHVCCK